MARVPSQYYCHVIATDMPASRGPNLLAVRISSLTPAHPFRRRLTEGGVEKWANLVSLALTHRLRWRLTEAGVEKWANLVALSRWRTHCDGAKGTPALKREQRLDPWRWRTHFAGAWRTLALGIEQKSAPRRWRIRFASAWLTPAMGSASETDAPAPGGPTFANSQRPLAASCL